jgi:hypothetical protein
MKREVAADNFHVVFNRVTCETDINKQMPVVTSTLIRKLHLRKFGEENITPTVEVNLERVVTKDGATPPTPSQQPRLGNCFCFLEHFDYMKSCLE